MAIFAKVYLTPRSLKWDRHSCLSLRSDSYVLSVNSPVEHSQPSTENKTIIQARARLGSALRVVSAIMPARKREYAAAAIIAALSVESARLGKNTFMPAAFERCSNVA